MVGHPGRIVSSIVRPIQAELAYDPVDGTGQPPAQGLGAAPRRGGDPGPFVPLVPQLHEPSPAPVAISY